MPTIRGSELIEFFLAMLLTGWRKWAFVSKRFRWGRMWVEPSIALVDSSGWNSSTATSTQLSVWHLDRCDSPALRRFFQQWRGSESSCSRPCVRQAFDDMLHEFMRKTQELIWQLQAE